MPSHGTRPPTPVSYMKDADFISKQYEDYEIPPDKQYLLHYFTGEVQVAFLKYVLVMGDCRRFGEHTGLTFALSFKDKQKRKLRQLTALHDQCKKMPNEEAWEIALLIETGQIQLNELSKCEERVKCLSQQMKSEQNES